MISTDLCRWTSNAFEYISLAPLVWPAESSRLCFIFRDAFDHVCFWGSMFQGRTGTSEGRGYVGGGRKRQYELRCRFL